MDWLIRRARIDDARAYADCQLASMRAAYAHFMPPEFFVHLEADHDQRIERYISAIGDEVAAGDRAQSAHWVAETGDEVVGICTIVEAPRPWEADLDVPPPPIARQLAQLYTRPSTLGSGLGQHLLDAGLPVSRGAYLWVMVDNPRAERFYQRNGFVGEGVVTEAGDSWHRRLMQRMWRPDADSADG